MKKKIAGALIIVSLLILLMLILPEISVFEVTSNNKSLSNNDNNDKKEGINVDIINMLKMVDESLVFNYLETFVSFGHKYTGNENCKKAGEYIFNEFKKMGLGVYFHNWRFIRFKDRNVVATLEGTDPNSDAIFIVCAHYDTIGRSPGANDDGSGIAAMLTIAKIMSQYQFNHTVRFIAFSGHEVGTYGSFAYVKKAYAENENIVCVLNVDMVGNTLENVNKLQIHKTDRTEWISQFTQEITEKYKEYIEIILEPIPCITGADETSFLKYGYDAVMFHQPHSWYPEFYNHNPGDDISTINFDFLENVTKLILVTTAELANKSIELQIRIISPLEGHLHLFDRFKIKLPGFNLYGKKIRGMTYIRGGFSIKVDISTNEEIDVVYYLIDDALRLGTDFVNSKPPYETKISRLFLLKRHIKGLHTLSVVATTTGKTVRDEMDIFLLSLF